MENEVSQAIIRILKESRPETVDQLSNLASEALSIPKQRIIEEILQLQNEGKITFRKPPVTTPQSLKEYFRTEDSRWYWNTLALATATMFVVFAIPEDAYPIVYMRYVLGAIFVLWLPGYTFVRALFPNIETDQKQNRSLDTVERTALSIGLSLALVPIIGLALNYTPGGIRLVPIVFSLYALTAICATVAVVREHRKRTERPT